MPRDLEFLHFYTDIHNYFSCTFLTKAIYEVHNSEKHFGNAQIIDREFETYFESYHLLGTVPCLLQYHSQ
jgi:hypothetical protein